MKRFLFFAVLDIRMKEDDDLRTYNIRYSLKFFQIYEKLVLF